jgi:tetraacyldisaccharide 4'-kinase
MKLIAPSYWKKRGLISLALFPLSLLYNLISCLIYKYKSLNIYQSKAKIITVGNINIGGVGKTPIVISLANILNDNYNKKIAVLTRGYGGKIIGPSMVAPDGNVSDYGDEALLIAAKHMTCIAKNRLEGIKYLESLGYDVIITDDGLQDPRFNKALSFLVIDGEFALGNAMIFPSGPLRESLNYGLKKADYCIVIGKTELAIPENLLVEANISTSVNLKHENFIAFAGIGRPEKFFKSVEKANGIILEEVAFGDHHVFKDEEIEDLISLANNKKAGLITTEKDYVRIKDKYKKYIQTLPVSIKWKNNKILNILSSLGLNQ